MRSFESGSLSCGPAIMGFPSEITFVYDDRIAGPDNLRERNLPGQRPSIDHSCQINAAFIAAWREAAGDSNGLFRRHAVDIRVLAGRRNFSKYKERPVGFDFDRDLRIAQITFAQFGI